MSAIPKVYVLISVTEFGTHVVAVFDDATVAQLFAAAHNVPGWHIKTVKYYSDVE